MTELERLKADLEVLERYYDEGKLYDPTSCVQDVQDKIARLEAEADSWRDAKCMIEGWRKDILAGRLFSHAAQNAVHFFDHLTAEVDRLAKRVAELEDEIKAEDDADIADAEAVLADMQSPSEGPIVGFDPVLEPARVLATGLKLLESMFPWRSHTSPAQDAIDFVRRHTDAAIKPYRLKGGESGS